VDRRLKALKALNMDRELPLNHIQEEIEENLNMLKSKLEVTTMPFGIFYV
jgi:hypothetical protein